MIGKFTTNYATEMSEMIKFCNSDYKCRISLYDPSCIISSYDIGVYFQNIRKFLWTHKHTWVNFWYFRLFLFAFKLNKKSTKYFEKHKKNFIAIIIYFFSKLTFIIFFKVNIFNILICSYIIFFIIEWIKLFWDLLIC